jgi:hypothetical protein
VIRVLIAAALFSLAGVTGVAGGDPGAPGRRGPLVAREEWLPAQALLTLPTVSPDPLARGQSELSLDLDWGNDFGWEAGPGGRAKGLLFMFDGEHRSATLGLRHGVASAVTLGLRVPLRWRGAGTLDSVIDPFHRFFGFPDSGRSFFPANSYRVEGRRLDGGMVPVSQDTGTGLGAVEAEMLWALRRRGAGPGSAVSLVGRVLLPTGSGPFERRSIDAGAQLAAARSFGASFDVYTGLGFTRFGDDGSLGFTHSRTRAHGFLALELRPFRRWSLLAQGDLAGRLITDVQGMRGIHAYLRLGTRIDIAKGYILETGFSEGIRALDATTDFSVHAGLSRRF